MAESWVPEDAGFFSRVRVGVRIFVTIVFHPRKVATQKRITLTEAQWENWQAELDRPAQPIPALQKLFSK